MTTSYGAELRIDFPHDGFDEREHAAAVLRRGLEAAAKAFVEAVAGPSAYPATHAEVSVLSHDATVFMDPGADVRVIPRRGPVAVVLRLSGHVAYPPPPKPAETPGPAYTA